MTAAPAPMPRAAAAPPPAAKASWAFSVGAEIAPGCRAVRLLGGGTLFEVYRAWDEHRLTYVVCKLVRPDQVRDEGALRQLRRESGLLARLSHPAIVRSLGARLDGPRPHLLLEHVGRVTLRRRLRMRGPLPLERVLPLARELGAAVHYLSTQGVAHLDIKPANVLLGSRPRLIDLSIARTLERARRLQRQVGTTSYMAPEQCLPAERGPVGSAADLWGLGITIYEALAGRLPFPASAGDEAPPPERYPQLLADPRPFPESVPPALADLLLHCLDRDRGARPTAIEFVAALTPLAAALPGGLPQDWPAVPTPA